jgi:hypothetical protein
VIYDATAKERNGVRLTLLTLQWYIILPVLQHRREARATFYPALPRVAINNLHCTAWQGREGILLAVPLEVEERVKLGPRHISSG